MVKIAVIGICGNSVFLPVDHFHRQGETLTAQACFEEVGGKGINQAVAAARMDAHVSFLAAVGDDEIGKRCIARIRNADIHAKFVQRPGEKTTFAYILTDKSGENRVTVYHGAALRVEDVLEFAPCIAESQILLLQNEVPDSVNEAAARIAKQHGVRVMLNPAPSRPIAASLTELVDVATPNQQEKEGLAGITFPDCVTTLGADGCSINDRVHIPACPVIPVDTTGAGDTFNGVLAVCLAEGKPLPDACRYAVAAAGLSVTRRGVLNAIPQREEIERMICND